MELQYFGANAVRIVTKKAHVVIDDNPELVGGKSLAKAGDIVLFSEAKHGDVTDPRLLIDQPGEYEVAGVSIQGIPARAHIDEENQKNATIYKIVVDDVRIVALGNVYPELNDKQLEAIGSVDVLLVPVGGSGLTLDPIGALSVIKKIEPKIIVPTHYAQKGVSYPVPQQPLEEALKVFAMEPAETVEKLKLKSVADLAEATKLIVIEKQ